MTNIYAVLEIGTSRTVLAVGEVETGQRLKVTCHAEIPSSGVRKSQIFDIAQAAQSVRSVLKEIERSQLANGNSITIGNAFLVVSGQHIKADEFQGTAQIARQTVSNEDLEEVSRSARSMPLPRERELLDIVERAYSVDEFGGIASPKGIAGRILKLDTLQIHAEANRINDARTAAGEAHLELRDPLFAATCAADAVLTEAERNEGAMVLDLGGGSTGYAIYKSGFLAATGVIGVGGDHITNDIATAFQTTQAQAEAMKISEAYAVLGRAGVEPRVQVPGATPLMERRTVSRNALDTVVNARCSELVGILRSILEDVGLLHRLHAGVVLTGGGAALAGLDTLVRRELGTEVRTGTPLHVDGLAELPNAAAFAAISGALMYAHRNYEEKSFFQSIFGGLMKK